MKYKVGDRVRLSKYGRRIYEINGVYDPESSGRIAKVHEDTDWLTVQWEDDSQEVFNRAIEIEPVTGFTVGEEYTDRNATKWRCIHIRENGKAVLDNGTDVIVNYADGSNVDGWDHLDFSFTKSVTSGGTYCMPVTGECHKYRIHFDIVNGKPDWQNAKVTGV